MIDLQFRAGNVSGMAIKSIVLSDVGGEELTDETHAKVLVKHPDNNSVLELDMSVAEASKLANTTLRLVEFTIHEPNKPARTALVESKVLDKLYEGVDFDAVLGGARKADLPKASPGRRPAASAPKGDRMDYTSPEHAGKLHRGRVTEAEAAWVKANRDKASKNRQAQTGSPIDWNDASEKKRYGL